ncbi:MAG TPA: PTS sugar transporter subunit IIA [Candidatus Binatia bacterium]
MKITDLLEVDRIILELKGRTKQAVLEELAELATFHCRLGDPQEVLGIILARERIASTAIGDGVAIPHCKMAGVEGVLAVFGRSTRGVEFQSPDGERAHLIFCLIAPEDAASDHLKALARISRLLKNARLRKMLLASKTEQEIFSLLQEEDGNL